LLELDDVVERGIDVHDDSERVWVVVA